MISLFLTSVHLVFIGDLRKQLFEIILLREVVLVSQKISLFVN